MMETETEWEYAARCGNRGYKYSWGNSNPSGRMSGNIADESAQHEFTAWREIWAGFEDGYVYIAPVGSFEPSEFGLYDMTGNVWEWCGDWYDKEYYKNSPKSNPQGPVSGVSRVLRGGSWSSNPHKVRSTYRYKDSTTHRSFDIGFRCVKDIH